MAKPILSLILLPLSGEYSIGVVQQLCVCNQVMKYIIIVGCFEMVLRQIEASDLEILQILREIYIESSIESDLRYIITELVNGKVLLEELAVLDHAALIDILTSIV